MSDAQTTEGAEAGAGDEESTDVNAGAPVGTAAGETESAEPSSSGGAGTTAAEDSADEGSAEDAEAAEAAGSDEAGGDGGEAEEADGDGEGGDGEGGEGGDGETDGDGQAVATATKAASEPDDPEQARLEEVGEHIRQAAQQAEEAIGEPGQKFYESGDERSESEDDQTIAPPG